jgi:hypothetical protein
MADATASLAAAVRAIGPLTFLTLVQRRRVACHTQTRTIGGRIVEPPHAIGLALRRVAVGEAHEQRVSLLRGSERAAFAAWMGWGRLNGASRCVRRSSIRRLNARLVMVVMMAADGTLNILGKIAGRPLGATRIARLGGADQLFEIVDEAVRRAVGGRDGAGTRGSPVMFWISACRAAAALCVPPASPDRVDDSSDFRSSRNELVEAAETAGDDRGDSRHRPV